MRDGVELAEGRGESRNGVAVAGSVGLAGRVAVAGTCLEVGALTGKPKPEPEPEPAPFPLPDTGTVPPFVPV